MINKNSLWVLTLVSLIIVLGIYYVASPTDNITIPTTDPVTKSVMSNETALVALRVENDELVLEKMDELQNILLDANKTNEEKNLAYEELVMLTNEKGLEEKIQNEIMETYKYESFVKIDNDGVNVVIANDSHDEIIANNIIRLVQDKYDIQKFITVKFQ